MNTEEQQKAIYANADKFINLANELVQTDQSGSVGAALRFAAARYSAFEASTRTAALDLDKEREFELFATEFANMLKLNLDDYIKVQLQK